MFHIRVERLINKDIEAVFDLITDHENYDQFSAVSQSTLLEKGAKDKNGEGALRRIGSGSVELLERITGFERPVRMNYLIERSRPIPMAHEKGEITLQQEGNKTRVVWISVGHMQVPVLGMLVLDRLIEKRGARIFGGILKAIESR